MRILLPAAAKIAFATALTVAARSVAHSHMILTLPKRLALECAKSAPVRLIDPPHEVKEFKYEMIWHRRLTADPSYRWLRDQIRAVGKEL